MRLAFIDLVFTWPPMGGAPIDLYHTMSGLAKLGHDVHLFYGCDATNWGFGTVDPEQLPFPNTRVAFTPEAYTTENVPAQFRKAVDPWRPDVVFICFGFFMKPFVTEAFADYRTVSRFYAYEPACLRDYRVFKDNQTCLLNYLTTPNDCRKCALDSFSFDLRRGIQLAYTQEFMLTKAYAPSYYKHYMHSLETLDAVIVYNHFGRGHLDGLHPRVLVIPGGVHEHEFPFTPLPHREPGEKKIIFMAGRANDPSKGLETILAAGKEMYKKRQDFEFRFTYPTNEFDTEYAKAVGWMNNQQIAPYYQQSDICVVPSLWEEPFGIVAVEAMSTGRPVCVSRVGGLQEIVKHAETGYIYERHDIWTLQHYLGLLLDDEDLRRRQGEAGHARVLENYVWSKVIETHYPPLLESLVK